MNPSHETRYTTEPAETDIFNQFQNLVATVIEHKGQLRELFGNDTFQELCTALIGLKQKTERAPDSEINQLVLECLNIFRQHSQGNSFLESVFNVPAPAVGGLSTRARSRGIDAELGVRHDTVLQPREILQNFLEKFLDDGSKAGTEDPTL